MSLPVPTHYTAYRVLLVVVLLAALWGLGWWLAQPAVLNPLLAELGLV